MSKTLRTVHPSQIFFLQYRFTKEFFSLKLHSQSPGAARGCCCFSPDPLGRKSWKEPGYQPREALCSRPLQACKDPMGPRLQINLMIPAPACVCPYPSRVPTGWKETWRRWAKEIGMPYLFKRLKKKSVSVPPHTHPLFLLSSESISGFLWRERERERASEREREIARERERECEGFKQKTRKRRQGSGALLQGLLGSSPPLPQARRFGAFHRLGRTRLHAAETRRQSSRTHCIPACLRWGLGSKVEAGTREGRQTTPPSRGPRHLGRPGPSGSSIALD